MAICRVYRERSERENIQWVAVRRRENTLLMSGLSREWPDWVDLLASQTRYNRCLPESVSECTTHRNLKQMSDVNRRPHHVPLLITGNRAAVLTASSKTGQQKMGKMLSTSYLIGLDWHPDDMVWIWHKEHESMFHVPIINSSSWWWCNGVGWYLLGTLWAPQC